MIELILLDATRAAAPEPANALAPEELARYAELRAPDRRREYLLGRILLKAALREGGFRGIRDLRLIETRVSPMGKPSISGVEFSLSHDGDAILLAIGDQEVGADLETVQEFDEQMLGMCFSAGERARIRRSADPSRAATAAWCMKEAAAKARGVGILADLGRPLPGGLFFRSGIVHVGADERVFAVASPLPLPELFPSPALPRFSEAFRSTTERRPSGARR